MSNSLYDSGRAAFLDGLIGWSSNAYAAALVTASLYTPNLATDHYLSDIPGGAIVATSTALTGKTSTAGVADASDETIPTVTGGQVDYIVIFQDTGTPTSSQLIALIDTASGLPLTPDGGDVTITFDSGPNRIFKL